MSKTNTTAGPGVYGSRRALLAQEAPDEKARVAAQPLGRMAMRTGQQRRTEIQQAQLARLRARLQQVPQKLRLGESIPAAQREHLEPGRTAEGLDPFGHFG